MALFSNTDRVSRAHNYYSAESAVLTVPSSRCVEWQKVLKMKLKTAHKPFGDHFDAKWLGIKGRLPSNAVPNPTDGCEDDASHIEYDGFGATINAPEMRKTSLISNVLPLNQIYDSNFGCLSEDSFNQVPLLVEEVYWW
ncbi:uncharacterized protein LOC123500385 isoform X2 [Portunus trituberculatus]|uniref:uncharacterized protein LOC123500385 isoform X2 n=1 Tax=Portunus trituberculatus TaxID=210409 RepID=UPI001E1CEEBD|nr:uncharacterized protein LOC123500385 isoform X2 [Portunus trituberculatus]